MIQAIQQHYTSVIQSDRYLRDAAAVFLGSMIIALSSQLSLTVPFTGIPFSLQPHAVLFLSAMLGPKRGLLCILLYLAEGIAGLPVFTHGRSTLLHLMSPSGGYLLSYIPVSYMIGYLIHSPAKLNSILRFLYIATGNLIILTLGTVWLAGFTGFYQAFLLGFFPFLITDMIKCVIVNKLLSRSAT